jgi:type I restriction enzyme S subunit
MMRTLRFHELVEVSPSVKLEKSKEYPFVDMAAVEPGRRYVRAERKRAFTGGGTRFLPGDTLFARITPCLENGKIAQYQGVGSQPAFGSTEFFVFRARPTLADPGYVYYLATSDIVRKPAEKSMSGASGRQRADIKSIAELDVPAPPLPVQRKIAAILSAYDDLIENNRRRIEILEEMAQALYREWFVEFRFPGHENVPMVDSPLGKIPEGWEASALGDHLTALESGRRPRGGAQGVTCGVPSVGAENIIGIGRHDFMSEKYVSREFFQSMRRGIAQSGDVALYKDGAYIGRSSCFRDGFPHDEFCVNEHVFLLRTTGERLTQNILYLWLQEPNTVSEIRATNANAAQPGINQEAVKGLRLVVPPSDTAANFDRLVEPGLALIISLAKRDTVLRRTRDLLLPRLISGDLDVSDLDIDVGEEGA